MTPGSSLLRLSKLDVARLANEQTPEARMNIAGKLCLNYQEALFRPEERGMAEHIFRLLLRDTEVRVRQVLAEQLKVSRTLPRDIVMAMVQDVEAVACPVLEFSPLLTEADLIDVVTEADSEAKLLSIARRDRLSRPVAQELIDTANENIICEVLDNPTAQLLESDYRVLVEGYSDRPRVIHSIVDRRNVPVTLLEWMVSKVSAGLAGYIRNKYQLESNEPLRHEVAETVRRSQEITTLEILRTGISQQEVQRLVEQLYAFNRLTPSIILTALCKGNIRFFETAMAKMAHIPVINARILINDRGDLGLQALCEKAGLPEHMVEAVRLVLRAIREVSAVGLVYGTQEFGNRMVEKLLTYAEGRKVQNMPYIIALARQNLMSNPDSIAAAV